MTKKDLKKHWNILKALKKGWIEPSDVEWYSVPEERWVKDETFSCVFVSIASMEIRLTKEGKEKINKAKNRL